MPAHAAVRGLVGLGRWNLLSVITQDEKWQKLALGKGFQKIMRGVETKSGLDDVTLFLKTSLN